MRISRFFDSSLTDSIYTAPFAVTPAKKPEIDDLTSSKQFCAATTHFL
jgi:hypothetical protein